MVYIGGHPISSNGITVIIEITNSLLAPSMYCEQRRAYNVLHRLYDVMLCYAIRKNRLYDIYRTCNSPK